MKHVREKRSGEPFNFDMVYKGTFSLFHHAVESPKPLTQRNFPYSILTRKLQLLSFTLLVVVTE